MAAAVSALLIAQGVAGAQADHAIERKGFTLALTIGPGGAALFPSGGGSSLEPGVGAGISLGAFVRPNLAVLGRFSGVGYFTKSNVDAAGVGVVGPALEWWLSDQVSLVGGIGLGFSHIKPSVGQDTAKTGLGLMLAGHWLPWTSDHHGLGFYVDLQPVFLADGGGQAFTFQGGFAWQYY